MRKELETLRATHEELSARISRLARIRLLGLALAALVLYLGFARALARVDTAELDRTRAEIARLCAVLGKDAPRLSWADDPLGFRDGKYESGVPRPPEGASGVEPSAWEVHAKIGRMRELYDEAFSWEVDLVVARVDLGIRSTSYAVPVVLFLFMLSEVYLHVLRKKRQLMEGVARHWMETRGEEVSAVERLMAWPWERPGAFARHPAQFSRWLRWLLFLGLLGALYPLFRLAPPEEEATIFVGTVACYAVVYGRYVSGQLEAQVASTAAWTPPATWVVRAWEKGHRWARWLVSQIRPRVSLSAGSLLTLMSLYLATTVGSCGKPEPGYKVVTGDLEWISADWVDGWAGDLLAPVGRSVYILSLLLAVFTIVLLLVSLGRPENLRKRRLFTALYALSGTISLFVLCDYTFFVLLWAALLSLPWTVGWLVPLALWYRFAFSGRENARARWTRMRSGIVALYVPLLVCDLVLLVVAVITGFYGLPVYFFGVHLLTLGYLRLAPRPGP